VPVTDAGDLREALAAALGTRGVVEKRRRLFLWQGVRMHLDEVTDLGHFIEFEAVAASESDLTREHALVSELREVFGLGDERLQAQGYAALLGL
jgi:adenylate cyclase class IV